MRPGGKQVYFLAGRKDDHHEYESRGAKLKEKLGFVSLQPADERIKLADQDIIHVGQTAIRVEMVASARPQAAQQGAESDSHCIECGAAMLNPASRKRAELLCVDVGLDFNGGERQVAGNFLPSAAWADINVGRFCWEGVKKREGVGACSFFSPPPAVAAWRFVVCGEVNGGCGSGFPNLSSWKPDPAVSPDCYIRDAGSLNGTFIVRPGGKQVYFLAGRKDDHHEYESRGAKLKEKLGFVSLQPANERIKLSDQDIIHVGQTAIRGGDGCLSPPAGGATRC